MKLQRRIMHLYTFLVRFRAEQSHPLTLPSASGRKNNSPMLQNVMLSS